MNKPVDSTKQIHSNNFYAFFVKKESLEKKLTAESISDYYEVLKIRKRNTVNQKTVHCMNWWRRNSVKLM